MSLYVQFWKDYHKYSPYEKVLGEMLIEKYKLASYEIGFTNAYDVRLSNGVTYELKCHPRGKSSGYIFVEYYSRGKFSGIRTSKSDYYVYTFDFINYYMISTKRLLILTQTNYYKIIKTNNSCTYGFLVTMTDFMKFAMKI
jgi:hypothetical protein